MQDNTVANISLQELKQALAIRERIEGLETELDRILDSQSPATRNGLQVENGGSARRAGPGFLR